MSAAIDKLFANLPRLPSIPKIVQELIASLCKEDVDISALVAQVKQDQSLSARVLQMANSSQYGVSKKIGAIDQAVTLIGLSALRSLVIASGMSRSFNKVEGVDMRLFWRHALVTAGVARVFGKRDGVNIEFAYTAGLMHRVGQLLLHLAYPAASKQLTREKAPSGVDQLKVERSLTETDHCEVGAELAARWNFPTEIQEALRSYITPVENNASLLAAVVNISSAVALGLCNGLSQDEIIASLDPKVMARLSLEAADMPWRIEACQDLPAQSDQLL
ncbi:HDOD domain-containing protein [Viridibacterium curvum]|uniref:HDOD domain-containing protein n=1 Tax=Viridibacterium curvum TaxID=1101404 RepID=A0ABP9QI83_9RHOO